MHQKSLYLIKVKSSLSTCVLIGAILLGSGQNSYSLQRGWDEETVSQNFQRSLRLAPVDSRSLYVPALPQVQYSPRSRVNLTQTPGKVVDHYHDPIISIKPSVTARDITSQEWKKSVENQNRLGTCASFAVVECLKHIYNRSLSQPYLIVNAEREDDCLNNGVSIGTAMKVAHETGVIGQSWWTYKDYQKQAIKLNQTIGNEQQWNICLPIPYDSTREAELIKFAFKEVKNLFFIPTENGTSTKECDFKKYEDIVEALNFYKAPVVVSVPVQWNEEWHDTGKISSRLTQIDGWHAITLYAYNNKAKTFSFKNSWGLTWGDKGLGIISYSYIQSYASEAWIGYGKKLLA